MRSEQEIRERLANVNHEVCQIAKAKENPKDNKSITVEELDMAAVRIVTAIDTLQWVLQDCDNQGCVGYRNGHCTKGKICKKK